MSAVVLAASTSAFASEWPQWRGPNRDGAAASFTAPARWPEQLRRAWSVRVAGGFLFLLTDDAELVVARPDRASFEVVSGIPWRKAPPGRTR